MAEAHATDGVHNDTREEEDASLHEPREEDFSYSSAELDPQHQEQPLDVGERIVASENDTRQGETNRFTGDGAQGQLEQHRSESSDGDAFGEQPAAHSKEPATQSATPADGAAPPEPFVAEQDGYDDEAEQASPGGQHEALASPRSNEEGTTGSRPEVLLHSTTVGHNLLGVESLGDASQPPPLNLDNLGDRNTKSAPVSPNHMMRTRRPAGTMHSVLAEGDITALAKRVIQEQQDDTALRQSIDETVGMARQRRGSLVAEPRHSLLTPVSLVVKTYPGYVQHPPGWRDSWSLHSHKEVFQSDSQLETALRKKQAQERLSFTEYLTIREEERRAKERRQAQLEAAWEARRQQRAQHGDKIMAAAQANLERRRQELESRNKEREDRSLHMLAQQEAARRAQIGQQREQMDQRLMAARDRQEWYDLARASVSSAGLQNKAERRHRSAQNRDERFARLKQRMERVQQQEEQVRQRAAVRESSSQERYRMKVERVQAATGKAAQNRQERLVSTSQSIQGKLTEKFARNEKLNAVNDNVRQYQAKVVYDRHDKLSEKRQQRRAAMYARDVEMQRKQMASVIASHWAHELELQAKVQNRVPEPREDVKETMKRIMVKT
mmetsp:Transcript_37076/g.82461  ORF Transcript_37076/g.82461 Transcript_37076/m.82461 type:complete len:612 (+) Transcript_37076:99-1934(+)|eukprot:CAMPEP_0202909442 /NCGR_PEP_ID=MMETSP1392-20130828/49340_1 /ASSEMBLY_ACC=CAM_ASM_000868 /TAXON_ID=225041 /ORGANISM="Chlamydomonas chlamydogama, Strain SAG 11-48b" /LENGTH=611 /DNA_ID=CAMNT_0049599193 /DNA_START=42 /DNA_END=1877 /DNA_ORIENTATION=-